jgi:hypothetical protein
LSMEELSSLKDKKKEAPQQLKRAAGKAGA